MLNKKALSASVSGPETDDDFNQTVLLLHGDGTNGAQNNTFTDSSTNAFSITRNGNTTQGTFSPFSQTGWSNYFNGTTDYLTTSATQIIPTGDFTIEVFVFCTSSTTTQMIVSQASGTTSGRTGLYVDGGYYKGQIGSGGDVTTTTSPRLHQWDYVVLRRSGSTFELYVNGTLAGSSTNSNTPENTILSIGRNANWINTYYWNGYISNLKISNTAITVGSTPTSPLTSDGNTKILTCQSNTFKDNSSNAYSITINGAPSVQPFSPFAPSAAYSAGTNGGSGYFDGTGDYLTTANGSSFAFGTGDFTIECWVYLTSGTSHDLADVDGGTTGYWLWNINSGTMYWQSIRSSTNLISVSLSNYQNQWVHFAAVRSSGTLKIYQNGVEIASASNTTDYNGTSGNLRVGYAGVTALTGYISNFRIVKGTAVYTAAFTPPTAPLTAITNTSLLCKFEGAGIIDSTGKNNLETVGNAQIDTGTKKFGTGSLEFDGTGDWLIGYQNVLYDMGSGDFTVEFWVNTTTTSSGACLVGATTGGGGTNTQWGIFQGYASSTSIDVYLSNGSSYFANTGGGNVTDGNWHHVAFTRSGSNGKLFLDGTQVGSTLSLSTTSLAPLNKPIYIGSQGGSYAFTGFIDDLRITKGVARYTANFTAPTKAFPDQ